MGDTMMVAGHYEDDSIKAVKKALRDGLGQLGACEFEAHYCLGVTLFAIRKFKEASESFKRSLTDNESFLKKASTYYWIGKCLQYQDDFSGAARYYRKALEGDPQHDCLDLHRRLGFTLWGSHDYPEAIQHFRRAVALDPTDHETTYQLGHCLWDQAKELHGSVMTIKVFRDDYLRKLMEAQALFKKAAELDPGYFQTESFTRQFQLLDGAVADGKANFERMVRANDTRIVSMKVKDLLK